MKLDIIEKTDRKMKFALEASAAFSNALRRVIFSEIPVMAIEHVDFEANSSGLFDEVIAHRLGLVPLTFSSMYSIKEDCRCGGKGCSQCEAVLVLEKKGPCIVKAGDMKSTDENVRPVDPDIPITELLDGQEIRFESTARLGLGRNHAKWQAGFAGYRNAPIVRVTDADPEIVDVCPTKVFEKKDGKPRVANQSACILCMRCTEISEGVSVSAKEDSFIFEVESVSGLSAAELLKAALDVLERRAEGFIKEAKKEL